MKYHHIREHVEDKVVLSRVATAENTASVLTTAPARGAFVKPSRKMGIMTLDGSAKAVGL